ncbi:MAG: flagellar hook-basal body complex protein FliE [Phycisphaerales bacterium]|nr:MAG: flagellar hook-basal body complex protein FliE [Phycisphaerales bacterium]
MTDPLGLIGKTTPLTKPAQSQPGQSGSANGPDFKEFLKEQIAEVNKLQSDAREAVEDLHAGRRNDLENVILATEKADVAFKMLLQVRNKVMEAYEEVKQIRV